MKKMLLRLVPNAAKRTLRRFLEKGSHVSLRFFARNRFLAALYYLLISRQFDREYLAVLRGRLEYWESLKDIKQTSALLRRNVHRLEKALIMRPRRQVFAERYIEETITCYGECLISQSLCPDELRWAADVLAEYFANVGANIRIDKARRDYDRLLATYGERAQGQGGSVPYPRSQLQPSAISFEDLQSLFTQRRSVRWYLDKSVDMALIRKAVNAASQAPSACNRQPYRFHVANRKPEVQDIADCAMGTAGYAHNLPAIVAVVGDLSAYPAERDRHVIYIDAALASMQLMLALETLGLSSCAINWPDVEGRERMLAKKLGLHYHERPVMLLAVGYADPEGGIPYSQKKTDALLVKDVVNDH